MRFCKVRDVKTPERGTSKSAGLDFFVPTDVTMLQYNLTLAPGQSVNIPSGIKLEIPEGHTLLVMNKSGVALNQCLQVGACVIDEDYQGELHLHVTNIGAEWQSIEPGQKLVQMVLVPVVYAELEEVPSDNMYLFESERGAGGFGSTGLSTEIFDYPKGKIFKMRWPFNEKSSDTIVLKSFNGHLADNLDKVKKI